MYLRAIVLAPQVWFSLWILWVLYLFHLSSQSNPMPNTGFDIPHFDKILHFVYFMGGSIFFGTYQRLKFPAKILFLQHVAIPLILFLMIAVADEYHQSLRPGRYGNDLYDGVADLLGASAGLWIVRCVHSFLFKMNPNHTFFKK